MAIVNNGVAVVMPDTRLPSGYTRPTVTVINPANADWRSLETVTVSKSSVQNPSGSITLGNLVTSIQNTLNTSINARFNATNNIVSQVNLRNVRTNIQGGVEENVAGIFYTDGVINYLCDVEVLITAST